MDPAPTPEETREYGRAALPAALPALGGRPARQPLPRLRARRTAAARGRPARRGRGGRQARQGPFAARGGHPQPHRPHHPRRAEDAAGRPPALAPRHQRPPRRLPLQRLHRLPRGLRERPRPAALGPGGRLRQPRLHAERRPHDSPRPVGPSPPSPVHDQHPVQPVHDLPHAPGDEHGGHLLRLHLVGQRGRRRPHVPEGAAAASRPRSKTRSSAATPRARPSGACGETASSWARWPT